MDDLVNELLLSENSPPIVVLDSSRCAGSRAVSGGSGSRGGCGSHVWQIWRQIVDGTRIRCARGSDYLIRRLSGSHKPIGHAKLMVFHLFLLLSVFGSAVLEPNLNKQYIFLIIYIFNNFCIFSWIRWKMTLMGECWMRQGEGLSAYPSTHSFVAP